MRASQHREGTRAGRALDAANFFLADVRDGLGPYLAVYLLTEQKWDEAHIGLVMSIADDRRNRRADAGRRAGRRHAGEAARRWPARRWSSPIASLLLPLFPSFWPVAVSQGIAHAAGVIFPPAIAAVSLGIVGHRAFTARIGRNETFNHAGNAVAAAIAGGAAYLFGPQVVFYLLAVMAVASLVSVLAIPENAIDHDLARGLNDAGEAAKEITRENEQPSGLSVLLTCRPLLIFAVCVTLFHLSNAAMLPLVGQKLALQDKNLGTTPDVGLHRRRPDRHGADGDAGRREGRRMGPQAFLSRRPSHSADPWRALYAVRRQGAGWSGSNSSTGSAPAFSAQSSR